MVFDIFALIIGAVAAAGAAAVVAVYVLTVDYLVNWFRERAAGIQFDGNKAAVTVIEEMNNGRVPVVQGVFDRSRGTFEEVRKIDAASLDDRVRDIHRGNRVVIWE